MTTAVEARVSEDGLRDLMLAEQGVWEQQFPTREMGGIALMGRAFGAFSEEQYDRVIHREKDLKRMAGTLILTGAEGAMTGAILGGNGQGKSAIVEQIPYVILGVGPENVAVVPSRDTLTSNQLLGSKESFKKTTRDVTGLDTVESLTGEQIGIINEATRAVLIDEMDYTSPEALAAARTLLQKGRIEINTAYGPVLTDPLDIVLSSWNQYGSIHGNPIEWATIARIALAVEAGRNQREVSRQKTDEHTKVRERQQALVEPVISRANLVYLREHLPYVRMQEDPNRILTLFNTALEHIDETLVRNEILIGLPRHNDQMNLAVKATALLRGRLEVRPEDIFDVAEMMLTAKLGCLGKGDPFSAHNGGTNTIEHMVNASLDGLKEKYQAILAQAAKTR